MSFPQQRSLRTGLTKTASNDRMGLKDGLKPISAPLRCSAGEAQLLLAKKLHLSQMFCSQETWTHIQDSYCSYKICLRYHCSAMERWLCRFLWNTSMVFPSFAWILANFCLTEFGKMWFYIGISELGSNSSSTINEIMTKKNVIIVCRYMAMHKLQDLGALPSFSVQLSVSLTS